MSHIKDLQKLRQARNSLSKPGTNHEKVSRVDKIRPEIQAFGLNLEKVLKNQQGSAINSPETFKRGHRKGLSINGFTYYDNRQKESPSPVLSICNYPGAKPRKSLFQHQMIPNTARDELSREAESQSLTHRQNFKSRVLPNEEVSKHMFNFSFVVGKGGFGKVWKVTLKKTSQIYAMKEMHKSKVIEKRSVHSVMNERSLLSKFKHPFLVNMAFAFQDRQNLYLVMDYLDGGDLRYHIGKRRRFTEHQTKFYIACILLVLQYLHDNNVIHRDIKPQNLVLDSNGYVRLTDLGISAEVKDENAGDTSGTPGYMAPEVICRKNHSFGVDFFALGVMGYEFMLGRRPYIGRNRKEIRDQILAKQASISLEEIPRGWSRESADFINGLLMRNPSHRLGSEGMDEVKDHPWLKSIDWAKLARKELRAPYIPLSIQQNYEDYKNQISQDTIVDNPQENALLLRNKQVQQLFQGYFFDQGRIRKTTKSTTYTTNGSIVNSLGTQSTILDFGRL